MTSFIGAPVGPHIGKCGNFFTGDRDGRGSRYCLEPVLALGGYLTTDRDICQGCKVRSGAFGDHLVETWTTDLVEGGGAQEWIDRNVALIVGSWAWYVRRGAEGASLEELLKIRADIEMRERFHAAVLQKMPPAAENVNTLVGAR